MLERLPVPDLSEAGIAVMHQLSVSGERPVVLLRAFQSGTIPSGDLPELIAFAWTCDDSPTSGATEAAWIEIFERAGSSLTHRLAPAVRHRHSRFTEARQPTA